ncbi:hypothetical protein NM688_g4372 [Phlebia brevispora]|uniref:Uncharacterized protein n=1 Tax=Phlebia brevispora TaxID=194682 RepID=A0ACC1T3B1_9APHY|nr:hypothetical protein NM688_g4372 [Phlebia brevispora]
MLRHATRKIPHVPIVTLDFLLPRFHTTNARRKPLVENMKTRTRLTPFSLPSNAVLPSQMLADENEQWLAREELAALGPKQYRTWNEENALLRQALQKRDILGAWRSWSVLAKEHLLPFFGPPHHSQYSRLLEHIQKDCSSYTPQETDAMEEMMLVTAVGGFVDGLKARLQFLIQLQDTDGVLRLYSRYTEMLDAKGVPSSEGDEDDSSPSPDSEDAVLSIAQTSTSMPHIRAELLLYAIVACAMEDSFREALQTGLRMNSAKYTTSMETALKELRLDRAMGKKVFVYLRRIKLAALFSRPKALSNHLNNLVRDKATITLKKLYDDAMSCLHDPTSGFVLQSYTKSRPSLVLFPDFAWAFFLSAFLRSRQLKHAEGVWDDMAKLGVKPSPDIWAALFEGYADLGLIEQARAAWSVMRQQGQAPTAIAWKAFIYAEFRSRYPEEGMRHLREFEAQLAEGAFQCDDATALVVYNTALHWLLFYKGEKDALAIVERMRQKGPLPDVVTFNTLLRYYARMGNLKALATTIQDMSDAGVAGDVFTYSIVLTALSPVRQDAIQVVLDMMRKHGVEPNVAMYTSIIGDLLKQRTDVAFRAALDILYQMEASDSSDIQPNAVTYTSILATLHRSNWLDPVIVEETSQSIAEKMMQRNLLNSRVTYNILIKACLENPSSEGLTNALRYYREMLRRKIFVANDTYHILLDGLLRRREWGLANEMVEEIKRNEFVPPGALKSLMQRVRNLYDKHVAKIT